MERIASERFAAKPPVYFNAGLFQTWFISKLVYFKIGLFQNWGDAVQLSGKTQFFCPRL